MAQFWIIIATQVLIAAVLGSLMRDSIRSREELMDELLGVGSEIRQLGRVVRQMAITQDDVKELADAVGKLIDIAKAALDAAVGDKVAKDQALADLAALRTEVAWLNDPDLDQKIDDMIAAANEATPAPDPDPVV